jgi:hypothetical protein
MSAADDLRKAVADADTVMDQALAFIQGVPAATQAAVDAQKAGDDAEAAAIVADLKAHADALGGALPGATPTTPPVVVPLAASFPDNATFTAAVAAYTGPEAVTLDGSPTSKTGTTPSLDYFTHGDQGGVIDQTGPTS